MPETNHKRRPVLFIAGLALAAAAFALIRFRTADLVEPAPVAREVDGGKLQRSSEAVEIFQRAFWRRARSEDKILHAERREWISETNGVRKWEWFLAIEPGDGLVADIQQRFSLTPDSLVPEKFAASPDWFRTSLAKDFSVLTSSDGSMMLVLSPDQQQLFATGSGGGFGRAIAGS